jgi:ABC-type oligopeptide transport system substrate-binding subunit
MRIAAPRVWFSIVALLLGAGLLAAAGLAEPAQRQGGTLRISRPADIDSVDPAIAYRPDTWMIMFATCAKLYNYPDKPAPKGAIAIPEVATGFPLVSNDGKTHTIRLRRTYRFHRGGRITAANFVAAFNRVANPKLKAPASPLLREVVGAYLREIVGADDVLGGRAQTISGVRPLGRYALEIRTTRPLPDLVSRLTMPFFCPIAVNTPLQEINDPLGSGPYYVASRVPNRQVVLERNPFYRGPRPANVERAVWTIHGREACRVAVERNELDYCAAFGVPSSAYTELAAEYGINKENRRFFFTPELTMEYFAFNHDRPAFKGVGQIPLKQAINWAIDRPRLVRAAGYDAGKRTDQLLPAALGRDESIYPLGDVNDGRLAKARALLAKARFRPRRLALYAPDADPGALRARVFQSNLKRLGIDVDIVSFQGEAFLKQIATRGAPYDVVLAGWFPDYADPLAFFQKLDGRNIRAPGLNDARFNRPRYTREIARIGRLSGEARRRAWEDLDADMMRDDPPWAPFLNVARRDFVSKSFGCYFLHPVYRLDIAATCKK